MGNLCCCCCTAHDPDSGSKKPLLASRRLHLSNAAADSADDRVEQITVRRFVDDNAASVTGAPPSNIFDGRPDGGGAGYSEGDWRRRDVRGNAVGSRYSHMRPPTLEDINEDGDG